jgi:hypothetical protein
MRRFWGFALVAFISLFATISPTNASQTTFDLTGTVDGDSINLVLTGTLAPSGDNGSASGITLTAPVYDITGATGTINGISVTGVLANCLPGACNNGVFTWDNLLSASSPYLDDYGLGLSLRDGTQADIYGGGVFGSTVAQTLYYYDPSDGFSDNGNGPAIANLKVIDPPNVAPEPASVLLFGTGLLAIAVVMRKRLQTNS